MYDEYKVRNKQEKLKKIESIDDRLRLVYEWVKTGGASLREFKELLNIAVFYDEELVDRVDTMV